MTCDEIIRSEIVEKYVLDQLSDETRDSFEQHYFDCGRCFGLLQAYRDVQAELADTREQILPAAPRATWLSRWAWVPAMAVVFIVVSVAVWQRVVPEPLRPPSSDLGPTAPVNSPPAPMTAPPPKPSLEALSRVEPPRYAPDSLRGGGEAAARFKEAMRHYVRGDYSTALAGLRSASRLDPEAPHILFFLGVSHLLAGDPDAAVDGLRRTIALGDSPYLEEAHIYLAKAYLRQGNVDPAIGHLESAIRLRGERETEARQLLGLLQSFTQQPR